MFAGDVRGNHPLPLCLVSVSDFKSWCFDLGLFYSMNGFYILTLIMSEFKLIFGVYLYVYLFSFIWVSALKFIHSEGDRKEYINKYKE